MTHPGIQSRTDTRGRERFRAYVKVDNHKVFGPWGTIDEALSWRAAAQITKPTPPPRKRGRKRIARSTHGTVYLVRAGDSGPVKIGWTGGSPSARLATLQTAHYEQLQLLETYAGTQRDERRVHDLLARFHLRGEWFDAPDDVLRGAIGTLTSTGASESSCKSAPSVVSSTAS